MMPRTLHIGDRVTMAGHVTDIDVQGIPGCDQGGIESANVIFDDMSQSWYPLSHLTPAPLATARKRGLLAVLRRLLPVCRGRLEDTKEVLLDEMEYARSLDALLSAATDTRDDLQQNVRKLEGDLAGVRRELQSQILRANKAEEKDDASLSSLCVATQQAAKRVSDKTSWPKWSNSGRCVSELISSAGVVASKLIQDLQPSRECVAKCVLAALMLAEWTDRR